MDLEQINKRLAAVKKHYPADSLLLAACRRLFETYDREDDLKKSIHVCNGTWLHFLRGKSRQGVRLAIIHGAARTAIHAFLLPTECKKE